MRNTLKHLTLLTRMKDDGLLPTLTGSFSEDAIAQACGQVETLQLQERLHIRKTKRIQEELVRVPDFAALYGALCRQEIGDEEIASALPLFVVFLMMTSTKSWAISSCPSTSARQHQESEFSGETRLNTLTQ